MFKLDTVRAIGTHPGFYGHVQTWVACSSMQNRSTIADEPGAGGPKPNHHRATVCGTTNSAFFVAVLLDMTVMKVRLVIATNGLVSTGKRYAQEIQPAATAQKSSSDPSKHREITR